MKEQEIRDAFRYHSPNHESVKIHEKIRSSVTETTVAVAELIPPSRERSLFITYMQQAQMMANAAVAIHSPESGGGHGPDKRVLVEYVRMCDTDYPKTPSDHLAYVRKNRGCPPILMLSCERKDYGYVITNSLKEDKMMVLDNGVEVSNGDLQKIAGDHIFDFEKWVDQCERECLESATLVKELTLNL